MKTAKYLIPVLGLAFAISPSYAQTSANNNAQPLIAEAQSERSNVEQAFSAWRTALSGKNPEEIVKLYSDDSVLLATLAKKPLTDQKSKMAYFTKLMEKPDLSVKVDEEHFRILDQNNAVISGLYTFSYEEAGKNVNIPARFTFVYKNIDGAWMIVEHHSSKVPEMN